MMTCLLVVLKVSLGFLPLRETTAKFSSVFYFRALLGDLTGVEIDAITAFLLIYFNF